jgi:uncharacterized protein
MPKEVRNTLKHMAWPIVTLAVVLIVKQIRSLSWSDDLGLHWPPLRTVLLWTGLFIVLFVAGEIATRALGIAPPESWENKYSVPIKLLRVFTMIALAPLAEELIFRGLLYRMLSTSVVGALGAVIITAVLFASLHAQYQKHHQWPLLFFILLDGLFFGVVVYFTGSVLLTIMLHSLGNLYAAYERLAGLGREGAMRLS